ncbi:MAG: hypothetical protein AAGC63_08110 [Propionicimonas sp.]|nr:hypothetical protein [Propionicimonas sp.]
MAFWLFNCTGDGSPGDARRRALESLREREWEVAHGEPHRAALAEGDLVLIYLAAPERVFIARAELASPARSLAVSGSSRRQAGGRFAVTLGQVERWEPPVAVEAVLARIDPANQARADFDTGVVGITPDEYEAATAAAASR